MSAVTLPPPLDHLLERLKKGDVAAAEQVYLAFEPYLCVLVNRQMPEDLRSKFDSIDIVQSVWGTLLKKFRAAHWQFASINHLRAFLIKATLNRFIDRVRQHRLTLAHEQPLTADAPAQLPAGPHSGPVELIQAEDVWQKLLTLCPEQHHHLLLLKRQGYSLTEIAAQTGLHQGSVRRILVDLARRFALHGHQQL